MRNWTVVLVSVGMLIGGIGAEAAIFNGAADNQIDSLGYYYVITGGKFVNGQTVTGKKDTGGSMAFVLDDRLE
ncbi:hypothetical protein LCGC14_2505610 [marine sediment metagenome]|uniref:Uncharacterized protein n=1 Tax=marine sediment metagenome TaxID=412755 RepID=A0A0F9B1B1_9ZZZZ